jgi:hypothetical protein
MNGVENKMTDTGTPDPKTSVANGSSKRTIANRLNAQKSTGPKTVRGKNNSKRNALKHGLLSKEILASSDTEAVGEYESLLAELRTTFAPADAVEEMLVESMAVARWRLARTLRFDLRERLRAIKVAGERLPEYTQEPAYYDRLLDLPREDPKLAMIEIHKGLNILHHCFEQMNKDSYLDECSLDLLKSMPGAWAPQAHVICGGCLQSAAICVSQRQIRKGCWLDRREPRAA